MIGINSCLTNCTFTDQNFESEVFKAEMPVLVDFWAPWCGPCRILSPIVEELAEEYKEKVKVGKLNVDDNPKIASQFGIMSIPTIMIFKEGKPIKTIIGVQSKDYFRQMIESAI
ncbi:thioredoxin [Candidatus Daviesbacteria bacterium]|nr:thioredoxin [Candidatus Daviesbacteria bacterium]